MNNMGERKSEWSKFSGDFDDSTLVDTRDNGDEPLNLIYNPQEGTLNGDPNALTSESSSSRTLRLESKPWLASSLKQMQYNENKIALDRAINQTSDLIYDLIREIKVRPVYYPTKTDDETSVLLNSEKAHTALLKSFLSNAHAKARINDDTENTLPEFRILKISLKIELDHGNQYGNSVMNKLDKESLSALLEECLSKQGKYLLKLKDRVDNTSSKVLITGDLNAGKSTFCNSLLRRKVLPEDQQPCTSVFCEVVDANKGNHGVEEVHAIRIGTEYNIRDESTYEIFQLNQLHELVYECDKYQLLKVFILDGRSEEESLLHNGVIDVKLIDSPGLNMDLFQTTQVFYRQEEIDLVVFVVSSENHFTLSAKEFIAAAGTEKKYVFIVANKFDHIKNKDRCRNRIMDQVKFLSPETYKNGNEFVHFVSSSQIPFPDDDGDGGNGSDDNSEDFGPPDELSDRNRNFDKLEESLRKFLLDKRSLSKLQPAKSYLLNILNDLIKLSELNERLYKREIYECETELCTLLSPACNKLLQQGHELEKQLNYLVEKACTDVYDFTKKNIEQAMDSFESTQAVEYHGLTDLYDYVMLTQECIFETVWASVSSSEDHAKAVVLGKVEEIVKFGTSVIDNFKYDKVLNPNLMFIRKRDEVARKLDNGVEIGDFFDPSIESFVLFFGVPKGLFMGISKQARSLLPTHLFNTVQNTISFYKNELPIDASLHTLYSSSKVLTAGAIIRKICLMSNFVSTGTLRKFAGPAIIGVGGLFVYYLISDIPYAVPRKKTRKLKKLMAELNYVHINSSRIAKECRTVLQYPSRQVASKFQSRVEKKFTEKEKLEESIHSAKLTCGYFQSLLRKVEQQRDAVIDIDLEILNTVE